MESCKAGLENRINAKEAQETLKMPRKTCHDALELGNQARFSGLVGYKARLLSSKRSMLEMGGAIHFAKDSGNFSWNSNGKIRFGFF